MLRAIPFLLAMVLAFTPAAAQIDGDLYLAMQSGDVRPLAARPVYLLALPNHPPAAMVEACSTAHAAHTEFAETAARFRRLRDSAESRDLSRSDRRAARAAVDSMRPLLIPGVLLVRLELEEALPTIMAALRVAEGTTGIQGHFTLDVPPGKAPAGVGLLLAATAEVGQTQYTWLVPVSTASGTIDLNNRNLSSSGMLAFGDATRTLCRRYGLGEFATLTDSK